MRINDGFYNNPNDDNVTNVEVAYDSMFLPTKRRWNGHVLAACMKKARIIFDNFPISVLCEWNRRADILNRIPVSSRFEEPPAVLLGDLSTVYNNHLFHDMLYCFKQICRYLTTGYDRQNTQKEI